MVSFGSMMFVDAGAVVGEDVGGIVVGLLGLRGSLESSSFSSDEDVDGVFVAAGARFGASLEAGRISILWISLVGINSGAICLLVRNLVAKLVWTILKVE